MRGLEVAKEVKHMGAIKYSETRKNNKLGDFFILDENTEEQMEDIDDSYLDYAS